MSQLKIKTIKNLSLASLASTAMFFSGSNYANDYLQSAENYLNNNEINSAIIELKNAIQSTPKDAQPRLLLGEVYLRQGNYASAEKELSRALHLGADKADVFPFLGRTLLNLGKNEEVIELVDEASSITAPQPQAELQALKAIAEINLGNVEAAKSILNAIKTEQPPVYQLIAESRIKVGEKDLNGAIDLLDQAQKQDPNNSDILVLKGHMEFALQKFTEATENYKQAYQISPNALHYNLFIARALVYSKDFKQATPYINRILKLSPNNPLANELQATILYSEEKYEDAKEHAEKALNNGSNNVATSLISAVSAYKLEQYEQANRRLKQVVTRVPNNNMAKRLYIATLMKLGQINAAVQNLEHLDIEPQENNRFLSQMSMELSKLGRDEEALSLAGKAYNNDQNSANELMLGLVKLADNDATGLKELQSAIADQPDQRKAEIGVAYYYLKLGKVDEAEAVANKWLKQNADDIDALTLKGKVYQLKKQFAKAETVFNKVLKINAKNTQAELSLAQALSGQNKFEEAYTHVYNVKKAEPTNKAATQILFLLAKRLNKIPEIISLINTQLSTAPSDLALTHQKAEALTLNNQSTDALKLLEQLPSDKKNAETWSLIGDIYYIEKQWYDAERAYAKWLDLTPTDFKAYLRNIHIKEKTNKLGAGIDLANKATDVFPNNMQFTLMKAALLIKSNKLKQAQKTLNILPSEVKDTPYALKLQGLLYIVQKDFSNAITTQEKIYTKIPGLVTAKDLASLYELNDQGQKAIDFLSKVIDERPVKARPLKLLLADIQSRVHPEDAIKEYTSIIEKEPKNVIALNNLSWIYISLNDYSKACDYSLQAYKIAGEQPAVADTHGYCLLKSGKLTESLNLLQTAHQAVPTNAEIALHYAESLLKNKQGKQAKKILDEVVTEDPKLIDIKNTLESELNTI